MKKTATILLLLLVFFAHLGYYFICVYQQYCIRQEVKRELHSTIPETELQIIIAEANHIVWEEEGEEFLLNGEMFDVVYKEVKNGKTYLHCLNDKKEQQLLDHLVKMIKHNTRKNRASKVLKYQVPDFEAFRADAAPSGFFLLTVHHTNFTSALHSSVREILTPPPRV